VRLSGGWRLLKFTLLHWYCTVGPFGDCWSYAKGLPRREAAACILRPESWSMLAGASSTSTARDSACIVATGSDHDIHVERPELLIQAVRKRLRCGGGRLAD
jgi:hypothetical protein